MYKEIQTLNGLIVLLKTVVSINSFSIHWSHSGHSFYSPIAKCMVSAVVNFNVSVNHKDCV